MLYSILKTSINITLVKEETGTTPYLYYIRARRGADEKFPKKIRKGEKKNIRSWYQKRTVLGRKTYGLGTKNVKRKRLKQKS